jgi:CheY-like chemotaxis protein
MLTRRVFKRSGIENSLVIAKSGPEVLALLAEGIAPLVVMLEIALPVVNGAGVLAAIRSDQRLAHTPVIMLTGGPEDRARLSLDRLTTCLHKPIDFAPLVHAMSRFGYRFADGSSTNGCWVGKFEP